MNAAPPSLQQTPLYQEHVSRGAKMVDFSGWEMPLQFGKVLQEHQAVRQAAGLFDISHMGLVLVDASKQEDALAFLNFLVPQDLTKLTPSKAVYTQFLNEKGGILDDIIVYCLPEGLSENKAWKNFTNYLVICNAGNTKNDIDWMRQHAKQGVQITPVSDQYCLFALQGPKFEAVLKTFPSYQADRLPDRFHIQENQLGDVDVLLARTGYTGEDGVEIIALKDQVVPLWNKLLEQGEALGCVPIGLAARDTLRLEAAYPLHGHDITSETSPLEAGLGWSVKLSEDNDFIGKEALLLQKAQGLPKRCYCLKIKKKAIAREHDAVLLNGQKVGHVTSGSISPLTNEAIALAYVDGDQGLKTGDLVQVSIRNQPVDAEIVARPFYKRV